MLLRILEIVWTLPQNLIGLFLYQLFKFSGKVQVRSSYKSAYVYYIESSWFSAISLGKFIIINDLRINDKVIVSHEYGHYMQNLITGPLYLIAVGIPSFIRATYYSISLKRKKDINPNKYYEGYPENWADKLGKVERDKNKIVTKSKFINGMLVESFIFKS